MTDSAVTNRAVFLKNTLYGVLSWLFPIVPTMIATPIVVSRLGNDQFGLLVVLLGFISYFFTTAIGKIAAKYVAELAHTGRERAVSEIVSATVITGIAVTAVGTALTMLFAQYIVGDLLLISDGRQAEAVAGLFVACLTIFAVMLGQTYQMVLQGLHRFGGYLVLTNLGSVGFSAASVLLALQGHGVLSILWANLIIAIIIAGCSFATARKALPFMTFTLRIGKDSWAMVGRYAAGIVGYQIFGNALLLFERGWIVRKYGTEALTYYAIPMTLAMYLHLFTGSLVLAMFPVVNQILEDREKLVSLYLRATKVVLTIVAFAAASAIAIGAPFLGLWLGDGFAERSYLLLIIHMATFSILAVSTIAWQLAESFRAAGVNAMATAIWFLVAVPLMFAFGEPETTVGVAAARLLGAMIFVLLIGYVEKQFLGRLFVGFWAPSLTKVLFAAILVGSLEFVILKMLTPSWATLALALGIGSVLYGVLIIVTELFDESERRFIYSAFSVAAR